ncbi:MAG TPA: DMT family transporter [Burkholderiaceae bacterium]|nr:DMT family transporter [Burkholderiaceae bacterium]
MDVSPTRPHRISNEVAGLGFGLLGVTIFGLTLPFTRFAVAELDPTLVALARALVAGALAAVLLCALRCPWPTRPQCRRLVVVSIGVVFGFPLASSWAMRSIPASHGAIVNGLLPIATAAMAAWRFGERPSPRFWVFAVAGSLCVLAFAAFEAVRLGHGLGLHQGDALMLIAVVLAALGYAEGGRLARELGGWQTICWALIVSLPVLAPIVAGLTFIHLDQIKLASARAWIGFGYVSVFSMFLGFFAWYKGLALGGIARVGQVQLLQIFITIGFAATLFGERVALSTWIFAGAVLTCVAAGRKAPISTTRKT